VLVSIQRGGKMGGTPDVAARGAAGLPRFVQKKSD